MDQPIRPGAGALVRASLSVLARSSSLTAKGPHQVANLLGSTRKLTVKTKGSLSEPDVCKLDAYQVSFFFIV